MSSTRELRIYGVSMTILCGALGAILRRKLGLPEAAAVLWGFGGLLLLAAILSPPLLRPVYRAWMIATWPLRWLVSHLALGIVFFGVVTPIGWVLRLTGHDPLRLRKPRTLAEETLWIEVKPDDRPDSAFQQF